MNWSNLSIIMSIVAVGISGISLIWNIVSSVKRNKPSLKVDFSIVQQFSTNFQGELSNFIPIFSIKVINVGFIVRDIENPTFKLIGFDLDGNSDLTVIDTNKPINFPIEILPGKQFKQTSSIFSFLSNFPKEIPHNAKIKIIIKDTYGRRYKSNIVDLNKIKNQIKLSNDANK